MYIRKVNGNGNKEVVEINASYEDIIKALYINIVCEQWLNENKSENITLKDIVDFSYSYLDNEYDSLEELVMAHLMKKE